MAAPCLISDLITYQVLPHVRLIEFCSHYFQQAFYQFDSLFFSVLSL